MNDGSTMRFARMSDGVRLAYRIDGSDDAPPLVFSNSIGTTHRLWDRQAESLRETFRVLRYDTRGHGASDAPEGPYALERLAADVIEIMRAAGMPAATFCGLSLGGLTAQWLLRHAPHVMRGAVLANTAVRFAPRTLWESRIEAIAQGGMRAISSTALTRWFTPEFAEVNAALVSCFRTEFEALQPRGYAGCCAVLRDADTMPDVTPKTPVLVIVGHRDEATPPAAGEEVAASIHGARIARLDAAHLSNLHQPQSFCDLVTSVAADAGAVPRLDAI